MSEATSQLEHGEGQHEHHIVSPWIYLRILGALLVGTGLTVVASYFDLGEWHLPFGIVIFWNPIAAIAIACAKATLVVLFFMHVKYTTHLTKFTVFAGIFTFLVLIAMTMADYISRAWGQW